MKKSEIKADLLIQYNRGLICIKEIGEYIGLHQNRVGQYMTGYNFVKIGNKKSFTIDDVADRITRDKRYGI